MLTDEVIFQYKCDNFYSLQIVGVLVCDDFYLVIDVGDIDFLSVMFLRI